MSTKRPRRHANSALAGPPDPVPTQPTPSPPPGATAAPRSQGDGTPPEVVHARKAGEELLATDEYDAIFGAWAPDAAEIAGPDGRLACTVTITSPVRRARSRGSACVPV